MRPVKKILFLGSGNISPINILCKNLIDFGSYEYQFDGLNLYDYGYCQKNPYLYITNRYDVPFTFSMNELIKEFFSLPLLQKIPILNIIIKCCIRLNFSGARKTFVKSMNSILWQKKQLNIIKNYSIVNAQFLFEWNAKIIPSIPNDIHVVVSFWGSDLMDASGKNLYSLHFDALHRANSITTHTVETREIMLSKFGRELKSKNHFTLYGFTEIQFNELYNGSSRYQALGKKLFLSKGVDCEDYDFVIKIGYSGFITQNHIPILREMMKLPKTIIERILFVIPMTYGASEDYCHDVALFCKNNRLNYLILSDYLSVEEARSISFVCNIMFNLRENDAFNNSMMESLMAGAVVFNGAWLPYGILKQYGVYYVDVHKIEGLAKQLIIVNDNFTEHLEKSRNNKDMLGNFIYGKSNAVCWENAFQTVQI